MLDIFIGIAVLTIVVFVLVLYVGSAAWAVGDAQQRGQSSGIIVPLFYLFGPLAALIWLAVRSDTKVVDRSATEYTNADDALAAASRLDQLGEWDAAVDLYCYAGDRWPEHRPYIDNCLEQIQQKQQLGGSS